MTLACPRCRNHSAKADERGEVGCFMCGWRDVPEVLINDFPSEETRKSRSRKTNGPFHKGTRI